MTQAKVMLLIDADNVSIDVIEQTVLHLLAEYGALHGRRAYCNPESALKHQAIFKRLGIRPMVNLAAGKNSTDIALAVDTMELVMRERPDVLAIASSDSDFAPLVTRVREKGCRVLGFGQDGKTGDSTVALYDRYVQFSARGHLVEPGDAKPARRAPARRAAAPKVAVAEAPAPSAPGRKASTADRPAADRPAANRPAAKGSAPDTLPLAEAAAPPVPLDTPAPAPAARKVGSRRRGSAAVGTTSTVDAVMAALLAEDVEAAMGGGGAAERSPRPAKAKPTPAAPVPSPSPAAAAAVARGDEVQRLLAAAPELTQGQAVDLNRVAEALRKLGLLGKNASSIRWLARFPEAFELTPSAKPNKVQLKS